MKFLSHLDVARTVARALRRAGVPMVFSEGFRPAPRLSFAGALQVGVESRAEYLDIVTSRPIDASSVLPALNAALPEGLGFDRLLPVDSGAPSLTESIRAARYRIEPPAAPRATHDVPRWHQGQVSSFLGRECVMVVREREGRREEIETRQAVRELYHDPSSGMLMLTLSLGEGRTPRPSEIVKGIYGPDAEPTLIEREELLALHRGSLVSPLAFCEQGGEFGSGDPHR
jgi:radical SAM-linked protein